MLLFFLPSPLVRSLSFVSKDLPPSNAAPTISLNKVLRMLTRLNYSAPLPPVLVPLAIAAMHTVGQGVVVARHRQAHLCLLLLTHCCLIFVQLPARGTFHFSQVANQARAAASLQQGLIMAEVEFSSPLRRDNAQ